MTRHEFLEGLSRKLPPEELPPSLPAGTRDTYGRISTGVVVLEREDYGPFFPDGPRASFYAYRGAWGAIGVRAIDWESWRKRQEGEAKE